MFEFNAELDAHLKSGMTSLCHAWSIRRRDGIVLGFTDHDRTLSFEGVTYNADSGLSARALSQSTGLSIDNTEAMGALTHWAIREDEIEQGRYDEAEVTCWLVNWADVSQRTVLFGGSIGEMQRSAGAFRAELRGLTEALNRPLGRIYQKPCSAVLGDTNCAFNLDTPGYTALVAVDYSEEGRIFRWDSLHGYVDGWFARGRFEVLDGPAAGLWGMIKYDRPLDNQREIELWEPIRGAVTTGTQVRMFAGCDKRMETCRFKFTNMLNFQGFPDIPNEDWVMAVPKQSGSNTGGSLR
ncbi:phage conserved hypothetical protein BR0599 [Sulfitobacter marinus]|uniref:Bacteriophage phiJL001 Gp84 C-terminal domain-containing protein n=1 Tax=Sulfitobacter marinus TaxID=394264 RepID=A0A1I6Q601_9RHOB|nr:DUF2163 domain-containing protein [Sulfitobacter marinus]SFS47891.1 phage conserved hypothetical protein BR0599 [Sulfitobacter marinus]